MAKEGVEDGDGWALVDPGVKVRFCPHCGTILELPEVRLLVFLSTAQHHTARLRRPSLQTSIAYGVR